MAERPHIMIVASRFYPEIADELSLGASNVLTEAGATFKQFDVPGAFEIPAAIRYAIRSMDFSIDRRRFDGFVALGCVIRGETTHYETVCDNTNHWLMDIATRHAIPLGNAILTVENEAQALERARGGRESKGAGAVRACLTLIEHERAFTGERP